MSFRQVQFCSNNRALLILCQRLGASLKPSFEVAAVCVNRLHWCSSHYQCTRWQSQFYDRIRTLRNRKVSSADNLYPGVLNLALHGFCSKYGWLDTSARSTVGKISSGFLRIVQFVLGKYDERISAVIHLFVSFIIRYSLFSEKVRCTRVLLFAIIYHSACGFLVNKYHTPFFNSAQSNDT